MSVHSLDQGWPNLRPAGRIRRAKYLAHFFKHHVSDCAQQCNNNGCCLSRKSHCIRPSSEQAVAKSALGSKRLVTPALDTMQCFYTHIPVVPLMSQKFAAQMARPVCPTVYLVQLLTGKTIKSIAHRLSRTWV